MKTNIQIIYIFALFILASFLILRLSVNRNAKTEIKYNRCIEVSNNTDSCLKSIYIYKK